LIIIDEYKTDARITRHKMFSSRIIHIVLCHHYHQYHHHNLIIDWVYISSWSSLSSLSVTEPGISIRIITFSRIINKRSNDRVHPFITYALIHNIWPTSVTEFWTLRS
jgi:hypothetical protein